MKWNVGDWCFFDYELAQIVKMDGPRVQEMTTGWISTSSNDFTDRCMPLTKELKCISDNYEHASAQIHREGHAGLNYPDIHRWMVNEWVACCEAQRAHQQDTVTANLNQLRRFVSDMLQGSGADSGYGFPLIRQRA